MKNDMMYRLAMLHGRERYEMKRLVLSLLILLSTHAHGALSQNVAPPARTVLPAALRLGNSLVVNPGDDLEVKHDWLVSADRDAEMGAMSATNRRVLILSPGVYELTSTWELDAEFLSVAGNTQGNPQAVIVRAASGSADGMGPVIAQTADDIQLSGFSIQNLAAASLSEHDHAFSIGTSADATVDNTVSLYRFMDFRLGDESVTHQVTPCHAYSDFYGTWENCTGNAMAWRTAKDKDFGPTMRFCHGGRQSYGGDNYNDDSGTGVISGTFIACIGGDQSFGGCTTFGMDCSADSLFIDCQMISDSDPFGPADRCFALGKDFGGTAINCTAGSYAFGGSANVSFQGSFSGVAIKCSATHADGIGADRASFGMNFDGTSQGLFSGKLKDCVFYDRLADSVDGSDNGGYGWGTVFTGTIEGCGPKLQIDVTADASVSTFYNGATYTNEGASGTVTLGLPDARVGLHYEFFVNENFELRLEGLGTDQISIDGVYQGILQYVTANSQGESCELVCSIPDKWNMVTAAGTWTKEP